MSTTSSPLDDFIYFCCSSLVYYVDYFIFLCLYRSQEYEINYLYFHCYIFSHCRLGSGPTHNQCWLLWYLPKTSFQQNKSQVCSQSRKLSRHAVCGVCLKLFCLCEVNTRSAPSPPPWPVSWLLHRVDTRHCLQSLMSPLYWPLVFFSFCCFMFERALTAATGVTRRTD